MNFLDRFFEKPQISNLIKTRLVEAESLHADRQRERERRADMTKLIVAFRNFANAPKQVSHLADEAMNYFATSCFFL